MPAPDHASKGSRTDTLEDAGHRPATLSRRQALAAGGGLAAALVATGSPAAAADAEPGDGHAAPQRLLSVSLPQARAVLSAAAAEARRLGVPSFIVVEDVCGDLEAASRQDGNSGASTTLAPLKAATALAFRTSTTALAERTTDPVRA